MLTCDLKWESRIKEGGATELKRAWLLLSLLNCVQPTANEVRAQSWVEPEQTGLDVFISLSSCLIIILKRLLKVWFPAVISSLGCFCLFPPDFSPDWLYLHLCSVCRSKREGWAVFFPFLSLHTMKVNFGPTPLQSF